MSDYNRRRFVATAAAAATLGGADRAGAEDGPLEAVRIVTGYSPGGTSDTLCHLIADGLSGTAFAKTAVVDNKSGSGGQAAVQAMYGAPTDGSVLLETPAAVLILYPHVRKKLGYDTVATVTAVTLACTLEFALAVGPTVPSEVKTLADYFAWCKAHPDQASFGAPGEGSVPYFIGLLVAKAAGIDLKAVDFGGTRALMKGLLDGKVPAVAAPIGDLMQQSAAGKIRLLGVSGKTRSRFAPGVPTFIEQGLTDMAFSEWYGFFLPGDASASVVLRVNEVLRTELKRADVIRHLEEAGMEARSSTPSDLATRLKADKERWGPLLRRIGIDVDA